MKKQTLSLLSAVAVAAMLGTVATPAAAERRPRLQASA